MSYLKLLIYIYCMTLIMKCVLITKVNIIGIKLLVLDDRQLKAAKVKYCYAIDYG